MSPTAKRLAHLQDDLSATQAVIAWLEEAYTFGSQAAYIEWAAEDRERNPLIVLPLQMIRAVRKARKASPRLPSRRPPSGPCGRC